MLSNSLEKKDIGNAILYLAFSKLKSYNNNITVRLAISPNHHAKYPEYLFVRRADGHSESGLFEFPGGKNPEGESPIITAHREGYKETGLIIQNIMDIMAKAQIVKYSRKQEMFIPLEIILLRIQSDRTFGSIENSIVTNKGEHDDYMFKSLSDINIEEITSETKKLMKNISENPVVCNNCYNILHLRKYNACSISK